MYYLQGYGADSRFGREEQSVYLSAIMNGVPVKKFTQHDFVVGLVKECSLMVGSVEMIQCALKALGLNLPSPNYYPEILGDYFCRKIIASDVGDLKNRVSRGESWFAKPRFTFKTFTGQVFDEKGGIDVLGSLDESFALWISEVVELESEFRCYVVNDNLVACCQYSGELDDSPSYEVVDKAIHLLSTQCRTPSSYTLDFGKLTSGETVVVEMGDGFSVGKYKGISDQDYLNFLQVRWNQLLDIK